MSDYEFKEPVEFTIRFEKEYVEDVMKTKNREIEFILEDILSYFFEYVEVL